MRTAAALCLAALALAGCGGGRSSTGAVPHGRAIFERSCSACHSLDGREHGTAGGDLALAGLGVADLASFARTMPVRPPLTRSEAHAVAVYVHAVAVRIGTG